MAIEGERIAPATRCRVLLAWPSHPFNAANTINGIDGDPGGKGHGLRVTTLAAPRIVAFQAAHVARVLDPEPDWPFAAGCDAAGRGPVTGFYAVSKIC